MTFRHGDKFRLKDVDDFTLQLLKTLDGKPVTRDTILTIKDVTSNDYVIAQEVDYRLAIFSPRCVDIIAYSGAGPVTCTCDRFDLFNKGCKCGWIEKERTMQ